MPAGQNWTVLECVNCSGTLFIRPFSFIKHPVQGTTEKPHGIVCFTCGKDSDPALMAKKMELGRRAKELEELQKQAEALEAQQAALDQELFEEDPVEVRDIVVKRAKAEQAKADRLKKLREEAAAERQEIE